MSRLLLFIFAVAIIATGLIAAGAAVGRSLFHQPYKPSYTTLDGPCEIRVYDDPLYAEHYAKNVNTPNCNSYMVQEQAQNVQAQTEQTEWNTEQGKITVFSIFFVVGCILALLILAIIKG